MRTTRRIAVTMGEAGGVGPEVIAKALDSEEIFSCCGPVVIGDAGIMKDAVKNSRLPLKVRSVSRIDNSKPEAGFIDVLDIRTRSSLKKGGPSGGAGRSVVKYIKKAAGLALKGDVHAIVTAPISKESLRMAGYSWPGHTELLAELTGAKEFAMMFVSERLKVILSTIHIPLKKVPGKITQALMLKTIRLSEAGTGMLGISKPRIAVAGLNPHAGESGIMGDEEVRSIIPAVRKARDRGVDVSGPYPPDVVFHKAYNGEFDIIVCMYHDQGLIPFKMLAFDTGVNVTVGLPVIRTSPDHGTGFDIAWKNMANPSSMLEAIKLATTLELRVKSYENVGAYRDTP